MDNATLEMAHRCFGYGRWDAPYWFIGPEQGQQRDENDDLAPRVNAWVKLGSSELCDCVEFHRQINQHRWHRDGKLQPTWRRLILLLMAFLDRPIDAEERRCYQRECWGKLDGETCVIELSGLPANNLGVFRDRQLFLDERMRTIRNKIERYQPRFVLMYGTGQRSAWENIAGCPLPPSDNIARPRGTTFALAPHPVSRGMTNRYWEDLGRRMRAFAH